MQNLEHRVAKLEADLLKVRFDELSDDELRDYAYSLPFQSPRQYKALIALILRHPSTIPIVHDDPAYLER
ncbi:MAG TPA: hypothetical protein PLB25_03085 [Rhodoferax sp.]|nr:hypothetical protein [Rhodoferax sp.]